jgi:hypothetical protein
MCGYIYIGLRVVFSPWIPGPQKPLSYHKIRDIRFFFAITAVTKMTHMGDSLLKTRPKLTLS